MTLPIEVKFSLERKAQDLAVKIVGVHSVRLVGGNEVDAIFDITPDESGCGLHFVFPLPLMVNRTELREFSEWLATDYICTSVH